MSNGENENSNESKNPIEVENNNETEKPVEVETRSETEKPVEAGNNTETENTNQATKNAKNATKDILAKAMALKESNPKVFFGGIGAVVIVILLIIIMSGGSNKELPVHKAATINIGQNYVLKGANASTPEDTVRLVAVPGSMAAYDDTEKDDRVGGCKHMPQGTPVKALQTQDAYGKANAFVQVEITSGECKGQKGWALAIDIQ